MGQSVNQNKGVDDTLKNIRKRNDGRWEYRKVLNGKRITLIASTLKLLEDKKRDLKKSLTKSKTNNIKDVCFYVNEWRDTYKANLSKNTKDLYDLTLNNYIIKNFGNLRPNQLNAKEIQKFINNIKKLRLKEIVCQHFKAILTYLYANGIIKLNLAKLIVVTKSVAEQQQKIDRKPLTLSQQKQLITTIKNVDDDLKRFILFSIIIGTRRNETLAFRLSDINNNDLLIHGTKTKKSLRTVKISNEMKNFLFKKEIDPNELYFKYHEDTITEKVNKILQTISPDLTLHCLRKTCSTNMHYLGVSDKLRQQILGHTSIRTTNDIYTNLEFDVQKKDVIEIYNTLYYDFK